MGRILLVQAPSPILKQYKFIPFSIAYIAALLEKKGYIVDIYDMDVLNHSIEEFSQIYNDLNYDIIGISSHTVSYKNALSIAKKAKELNKNIVTVLGGHHVTFMARQTFQDSNDVDIVVIGEGETTFLEIANHICIQSPSNLNNIKGIVYIENGKCRFTPSRQQENIAELPYPARHLLELEKYTPSIIASRGCPNRCAFCAGPSLQAYRTRDVDDVINELQNMLKQDMVFYSNRGIAFLDNTFVNPKYTLNLCKKLQALNLIWTDCMF